MATVGTLVVKIGTDISGFEKGLGTVQARLQSAGQQMRSLGAGLTLGLTAPIVGIATAALNSAAGFEKSMNLMQAMSGASADQMKALSDQALELGAVTSFSAGEAAEAMLELSKAGLSVDQVGGAIPGVLDLAAAANMSLADAATVTANTLNTFGLEAGAAASVANVLAGAANASSADVSDLALGMKAAGAVFSSNNQSVEDMATALAILANNGIAGSDAGTSLKTMMMRLAAPTDGAVAALSDLGVKVYDATGAMQPFEQILGQLAGGLGSLSDEQRNAALQTIFGADAIRAATILAAQGADGFDEMRDAVIKEGAAALLANANMSGLSGAIEYFKGSIDSLLISTAMPYLDMLGEMIRGAADLLTRFQDLPPSVQRFAAVLTAVLAVGGPLLVLLGTMLTAIAALVSPIGLVVAALVVLGAVAVANWGRVAAAVQRAVQVARPALDSLQSTIDGLRSGDITFQDIGTGVLDALKGLPEKIQGWASTVDWAGLIGQAGDVAQSWKTKVQDWLNTALALVDLGKGAVADSVWIETLRTSVQGRIESGLEMAASGIQTIKEKAGPLADTLRSSISTMLADATAGLQEIKAGASPAVEALRTKLQTALDTALGQAAGTLQGMEDTLAPIRDTVTGWFQNLTWDDTVGAATTAFETLGTTVNGWRDDVFETLTGWVDGVDWSQASLDLAGMVDWVTSGIEDIDLSNAPLGTIMSTVVKDPLTSALGKVEWVVGSEKFDGLKDSVYTAISSIDWAELLSSVGGLADASLDLVTDAANQLIQGYIDKLTAVDWTQLSIDFAGLLEKVSSVINEIDWQQVGSSIGTHLRELFVGNEEGEGGLLNLATAVYDAIVAIDWYGVLTATGDLVTSLGTAILQVVGSAIATLFGATLDGQGAWVAPQWVTDLNTWLEGVLEPPQWVIDLDTWLTNLLQKPGWVQAIEDWWEKVTTPPAWLSALSDFTSFLDGFSWPSIREPSWLSDVRSWWNSRPSWMGGDSDSGSGDSGGSGGYNATGTPNWPGGWTRVGEYGPELVRLPAGSQIFDHRESAAMVGGAGQTVNITANIHQDLDWEELRWRLQDLTRRRS